MKPEIWQDCRRNISNNRGIAVGYTRRITNSDPLYRRLQPLRYLHDCSDCYRPERFSRVGLSPTDKAPPWHAYAITGHLGCLRNFRFLRSVNDGFSASNLESSSARPGQVLSFRPSTKLPSERPLHSETCQTTYWSKSATADLRPYSKLGRQYFSNLPLFLAQRRHPP